MSVLVEAQGEMLDNIEAQVSKSVDYVHRGTSRSWRRGSISGARARMCVHHHRAAHSRHLVAGAAALGGRIRVTRTPTRAV